jgi:hypothetical protein
MFDFNIRRVIRFQRLAYYGFIWLVEFNDSQLVLAVDDTYTEDGNYVLKVLSEAGST